MKNTFSMKQKTVLESEIPKEKQNKKTETQKQ